MTIPDHLRAARARANLSQSQADKACGLCRGQFAAWEHGRNEPLAVTLEGVLARLAKVEPVEL